MVKPASKSKSATSGRNNQLRIIGGAYRRRILSFPDGEGLRPTPDRVRETLFNWLGQEIPGWVCLDLFAGSGALGFEAASRGAARVVMVEQARPAVAALMANRTLLQASAVDVVAGDALAWLSRCQEQFDLVMLDPPFASDYLQQVLAQIAPRLTEDARVYIETGHWPDELPGWEILREGKAGVVRYGLLRQM
ncbi:MAG: 16S rRNA (guanine(966)-N(2))-methyltransferase RsmD [Burkholderiales bacterium]|nr:16S rRNA (guanine(966)-N(2))-methyltransferase RsmD [Burkholderiales bacterium]